MLNSLFKYAKPSYIVLAFIILWDALHAYVFRSLGYGYILLFVVMFGVGYEMQYKYFWNNMFKKPIIYWFIWLIYVTINTFIFKGYNIETSKVSFIFVLYLPLFVVLIISSPKLSFIGLVNVLIASFFLRILLTVFFDSFAAVGKNSIERLGADFNSNSIAFGALFIIVLILFKKITFKKNLYFINYFQLVLALYIIMETASRKTAIAIIIIVIGYIYINRSKDIVKRYLKYAFAIFLLTISGIFILNNTTIGHRLVSSYHATENASSPNTMFDSRMGQYIQGYYQFIDNPITGVGLYNFGYVGPVKITAHSEYIVQFAECGLIGVLLSLLFYRYIFRELVKSKKFSELDKKISEYFIFFLLSSFFLMSGAWVYNLAIYWIIIGLIIKYIKFNTKEISISKN